MRKIYYYINTGHRVGLDRLRRSAPVIKAMNDMGMDVVMLSNDFRAGEYAKEHFGLRKYVSVDTVRNIANIATPADCIIFDSEEEKRSLWREMADYFHTFIRISDNLEDVPVAKELLISSVKKGDGIFKANIVDPRYFDKTDHNLGNIYFFGDDDYNKELAILSKEFKSISISLLEGYYFFMRYKDELQNNFKKIFDNEEYDDALKRAGRFITSSTQSALEALAAGSKPLYLKRPGQDLYQDKKMQEYGIPVIESFEKSVIEKAIEKEVQHKDKLLQKDTAVDVALYIKDKIV